eukprot:1230146-Rhodomonas_salina.3
MSNSDADRGSQDVCMSRARGVCQCRHCGFEKADARAGAGRFMGPIGFVIFAPTVFALSYVVWKYIDQPVSKWLSEKIRDVTEPISDLLKF